MVDATDLVLAATLVQTIVITLTLMVFIFQFRSQERAIKESSYQNLMGRYNDFIMTQVSHPELNSILAERLSRFTKERGQPTSQEAAAYGHLLIAYGILEEAFVLFQKNWIDEETWTQWAAWLGVLIEIPQFILIHSSSLGMFDKGFQEHVGRAIKERQSTSQSKSHSCPT